MDLSIITVTWNSADKIAEQICSVALGCKNLSYEHIIIDNNSTDDTVKIIKEQFPNVILIENNQNSGFGAANNQGAKIAKGEFLLLLNPDMRVEPASLDSVVEWLRPRTDVGIVSCMLMNAKGEFNLDAAPRRFPGIVDQLALVLKIHHLFPSVLNKYLYQPFDYTKEQQVDSVRGAFMLLRPTVVEKLGWAFDPRYFFWFEDVDTCREVQRLGLKVMYTPIISCVDYVGQSVKKRDSLWKQKNFTASMLVYFKKWEPRWKWSLIAIARPVGVMIVRIAEVIQKNINK